MCVAHPTIERIICAQHHTKQLKPLLVYQINHKFNGCIGCKPQIERKIKLFSQVFDVQFRLIQIILLELSLLKFVQIYGLHLKFYSQSKRRVNQILHFTEYSSCKSNWLICATSKQTKIYRNKPKIQSYCCSFFAVSTDSVNVFT